jgi:anti-anti-sigma factor
MAIFGVQHVGGQGGQVTLEIAGELDHFEASALTDAIDALAGSVALVRLDCARLDFLDAGGLRGIVSAEQRLGAGRLHVLNTRPNVRRIFEICGLTHLLVAGTTNDT